MITVQSHRRVSDRAAERFGIRHETPQAILLQGRPAGVERLAFPNHRRRPGARHFVIGGGGPALQRTRPESQPIIGALKCRAGPSGPAVGRALQAPPISARRK